MALKGMSLMLDVVECPTILDTWPSVEIEVVSLTFVLPVAVPLGELPELCGMVDLFSSPQEQGTQLVQVEKRRVPDSIFILSVVVTLSRPSRCPCRWEGI